MNDKIKEIAKIYRKESWCYSLDNGDQVHGYSYEFDEEEFEQFIKIIIEECCVAIRPHLRDMISRGKGVELIKSHFGIEQ